MSMKMEGSFGPPSMKLGTFTKDGPQTSQRGPLANGVRSLKNFFSRAKPLPTTPKIDKGVILAKATGHGGQTAPVTDPQVQQQTATLVHQPPVPLTPPTPTPPKDTTVATTTKPSTQKLDDKTEKQVNDLAKELGTLKGKVHSYAEAMEQNKGSGKEATKQRVELTTTRLEMQKTIEKHLTALDAAVKAYPDDVTIKALRTQLVGLSLDIAFPDAALKRENFASMDPTLSNAIQKGNSPEARQLKADAQLADIHKDFAETLSALRSTMSKPELATQLTGVFLKAVADMPLADSGSMTADEKMQTALTVVKALAKGDVSIGPIPLLSTSDKAIKSVLSEFRANHYGNDAARHFLDDVDTLTGGHLAIDTSRIGSLNASEIRKLLPQDNADLLKHFDAAVKSGKDTAKLRDEYEAQRTRTARALGPEKMQIVESSIRLMSKGAIDLDASGDKTVFVQPGAQQLEGVMQELIKTNKDAPRNAHAAPDRRAGGLAWL